MRGLANPGEFSERAFLNNKIDLLQAEAIADLIESNSTQAAKSAMRTLKGEFSRKVHKLLEQLIEARVHIEATIDFSDEDIDFVSDNKVGESLHTIHASIQADPGAGKAGRIIKRRAKCSHSGKTQCG